MPRTVDSFPDEFIRLYLSAYQGEVSFKLLRSQAVTYRQQLHTLRAAMKREGHPVYEQAKQVEIVIRPVHPTMTCEDDICTLKVRRRKHGDFAHLIRQQLGNDGPSPQDFEGFFELPPVNPALATEDDPKDTSLDYGSIIGATDDDSE